jgi:hypothetical protein
MTNRRLAAAAAALSDAADGFQLTQADIENIGFALLEIADGGEIRLTNGLVLKRPSARLEN